MQKNNNLSILILGLGGNVSQGILKAIRSSGLPARIVGGCVSAKAAGLYFCDKALLTPYADDAGFVPWLGEVCRRENIDLVLSGVEEVLDAISNHVEILRNSTNAAFVVSPPDKLKIGRDKLQTCHWLKNNGFSYPDFCVSGDASELNALGERCAWRLIAKPRWGKGSSGILRSRSEQEARSFLDLKNYIIEEEIGSENEEYTVGCYRDKLDFTHVLAMRRYLTSGTTSAAVICDNAEVLNTARSICDKFAPTGPLNAQIRLDKNGKAVCFELNVRFSGTTPMRAHFGFRDVEAAIREYVLNEPVASCFEQKFGIALRFWEELYIRSEAITELGKIGILENPSNATSLTCPRIGTEATRGSVKD